jgi:hypothetical protein
MLISLDLLSDLQNTVASRQKLEGQRQENLGVQRVSSLLTIFELPRSMKANYSGGI